MMKRLPDAAASLEMCRAELAEPIRLTELAEDWRRDLNALASRSVGRDRDAVRRIEAALTQSGEDEMLSAVRAPANTATTGV
ncbi:hypothetical protein PPMP20_32160 [Paraburkholderia phymatum]|uniref:Uncharacterized protein n=1 Tax=Paraburkholderia phymatum (strain DSM 17167 / CIP 108236 / LMG 21445 / STM815) TaxID=391038 RepID=B2JH83_PARP8|nr:hypothetical protein [Paraburkholderia phymatum]ACC70321.1 hypothetical protein Bphy_1132 [Paraburkholderia phymatum STM815]